MNFFDIFYSKFQLVSTFSIWSNFCVENWLLCCGLICKWVTCRSGCKRFWKSALQMCTPLFQSCLFFVVGRIFPCKLMTVCAFQSCLNIKICCDTKDINKLNFSKIHSVSYHSHSPLKLFQFIKRFSQNIPKWNEWVLEKPLFNCPNSSHLLGTPFQIFNHNKHDKLKDLEKMPFSAITHKPFYSRYHDLWLFHNITHWCSLLR